MRVLIIGGTSGKQNSAISQAGEAMNRLNKCRAGGANRRFGFAPERAQQLVSAISRFRLKGAVG